MPVVAAFRSGAALDPLAVLLFHDIVPVVRFAGLGVEGIVHILEHRFLVTEVLARLPIVLPENAGLAGAEDKLLAAIVNEDALEDFIEIERFTGSVIVVPRQLACIGV